MKLLEEKGLREKIINECIKYENELYNEAIININKCENAFLNDRVLYTQQAHECSYAREKIKELRFNLMQLLDNEKVE